MQTAGACFSGRVVSDTVTRLRPGLGGGVHPGPRRGWKASGSKAGCLGVGAPLAQGSLYSADLSP